MCPDRSPEVRVSHVYLGDRNVVNCARLPADWDFPVEKTIIIESPAVANVPVEAAAGELR